MNCPMECGGKRSATPLWLAAKLSGRRRLEAEPKRRRRWRFAGAVHIAWVAA